MSSTSSTIYTGFWTNWEQGRIGGATITLTQKNSAFLIAFIALFVRFVGGQLWAVLAFLASVTRSTAHPQDAIYHQQQAILRNTSQPAGVSWAMFKLLWFWTESTTKSKMRILTFVFTGLAYVGAFAVAGIFSSKISDTNSQVLLNPSPNCGLWPYPYLRLFDPAKRSFEDYSWEFTQYATNFNQLAQKSHVYVSECYNSTDSDPSTPCLPYGKSRIAWTTDLSAQCPFDEGMCLTDAIQFDSGYLNSYTHLGINTKHDRVEYRRVMTCAPITTDGYMSGYVNATNLNITDDYASTLYEGDMWLKYAYGQSLLFNDNTTYAYSNFSFDLSQGFWLPYRIYDLDVEISAAVPDDPGLLTLPTFTAIPSLSLSDADTNLIFLSQNVSYLKEVRDPWFQSTIVENVTTWTTDGSVYDVPMYNPNARVSVVACAEQHQLRNPNTGAITPLGGLEILTRTQAQNIGFTENQLAIFDRSFFIGAYSTLGMVVSNLGGSRLLAVDNMYNTQSTYLPDNQWQLEFEHYFGICLNTIQLWTQQYVTGLPEPDMRRYVVPASGGLAEEMCNNQIARRTDYRSFSVLGLVIILGFGFLCALANMVVEPFVVLKQKHSHKGRYRNAEWQANELLQLQRMAYEHSNIGTWTGQQDMVPRTRPGEIFTLPDSTQWNHGIPEPLPSDRKRLFRTWSRGTPNEVKHPHSPTVQSVGLEKDSKSFTDSFDFEKKDDESVLSATDFEKTAHIIETQLRTYGEKDRELDQVRPY